MSYADPDRVVRQAMRAWRPPPELTLSEWADQYYYLSPEGAAEPGKWTCLPYQRGWLDAMTDPTIEQVSIMKSSRVGYTLGILALAGYHVHQDPCGILIVQPTVEDSKGFSKEMVAPMLRDVPVLSEIAFKDLETKGPKDSSNTLTHKTFPGGVLSLIGANSGTGFRRVSRRVIILDEVDAYPPSAGSEGDPIKLATMRSAHFWNRKIVSGSTPLIAGHSRIEDLFNAGDRRRYHVPCPHCGHRDYLTFREESERGHFMAWPEGRPQEAHFVCRKCGCVIEHNRKREMIEAGEWVAEGEFTGHASFHLWAAYSYAANATWAKIAAEFLEVKNDPLKLRVFVNTTLGETWREKGEAPDWQRLYQLRENYPRATVPAPVVLITAGVDVQRNRLVWEVVGWGEDKQSWSIDSGVIPGDTSRETGGPWDELDALLAQSWPGEGGALHQIRRLAVDSGDQTQTVYNWARRYPRSRVLACKGSAMAKTLLGAPTAVDVMSNGRRITHGCQVWIVGVNIAKSELYGWLRLQPPTTESGEPYPIGYCHFPEYGEDYFKQLTAEHLVSVTKRTGFRIYEWQIIPGRENHWLDCRVLARAAANSAGLDRIAARARPAGAPPTVAAPPPPPAPPGEAAPVQAPESSAPRSGRSSWLGGGGRGFGGRRGSWLHR